MTAAQAYSLLAKYINSTYAAAMYDKLAMDMRLVDEMCEAEVREWVRSHPWVTMQ